MKKLNSLLFLSVLLITTFYAKSQTIDYAYKSFSASSCNIFSTTTIIDNYEHQTSLGRPKYNDNSVLLESKTNGTNSVLSTIYSIKYNFKIGYNYKISVYYKGEKDSDDGHFPSVGMKISLTNEGTNSNSDCVSPQAYSIANANIFSQSVAIGTYGWKTNLIDVTITQPAEYLIVGAFPWVGTTKAGKVFVRKIQIIETPPLFTISPISETISCGSTSSKIFTVNNLNNPQGTLSYDWNLGGLNNGWYYQGGDAPPTFTTSNNSIELTPSPSATSLSNVSVTIKLNGSTVNTLTSEVSLSNLPITVIANQLSCTDLQLSISGGSGNSYNWSTSDGDLLFNGSTTTALTTSPFINATGTNGFINVTATNPCGMKNSNLVYEPFIREAFNIPNPMIHGDHLSVSVNTTPYDINYRWYVNGVLVKDGPYATSYCTCFYEGPDYRQCGNNIVRVEVDNCSSTSFYEEQFEWICGYGKMQSNIELFPNPARSQITVRLKQINDTRLSNKLQYIKEVRILNKFGNVQKIFKYSSNTKSVSIDVSNLSFDIYYVEVSDGFNKERMQMSIQK
jgi:hypothetical protein